MVSPDILRRGSLIFSALADDDIAALLRLARGVDYAARKVVFREGETGDTLMVVLDGRVKVTLMSPEGKEAILSVLKSGEVFGEMSLLDGGARSATVTTMEKCRFLEVSRREFLGFLEAHPRAALSLLAALSRRLRATNDQVGSMSFLSLQARLARTLINLARQYGSETPQGMVIGLRLSQEELGNLVGVSRESVNRQVRLWTEAGVLSHAQGTLILKDLAALEREVAAG